MDEYGRSTAEWNKPGDKERHCMSPLNIYQLSALYGQNWKTRGYWNMKNGYGYCIQYGKRLAEGGESWGKTLRKIERQDIYGTQKWIIIC